MASLAEDKDRLAISRLYARFGFGPRPGEFAESLSRGLQSTQEAFLVKPDLALIQSQLKVPDVEDLGDRPEAGSDVSDAFGTRLREQNRGLALWWLDQMATTEFTLNEKMVWFWHGHWATSIEKVKFALPMYDQNQRLRTHALGNFATMSQEMFLDGALQIWLDGQDNTAKAPNENLAREFMELFTLGVGRYTEEDVKALSRIFTGYTVDRTSGELKFVPRRHDSSPVTLLGQTKSFSAEEAVEYLVSRKDCAQFISERIWYRFFSESQPMPKSFTGKGFEDRNIGDLVSIFINSPHLSTENMPMVKSPVEWCIAICRAFGLVPSQFSNPQTLLNHLSKMSQVPFMPPSVGGWPAGGAWLTSASAQFRLSFAQYLIKSIDLAQLRAVPRGDRINYLRDLLGIYQLSSRTEDALRAVLDEPARLILLLVNSPEYVVGV
jgi:uncharacterized protein (DUF1800 family)